MTTKITRDIIESYLKCKYKGHLKLAEQQGSRSEYELLLNESRDVVRRLAIDKIVAHHPDEVIEKNIVLTPAVLKRGAAFLLNATLEDEHVSFAFDGLKRLPGHSKLGDFYYVPVLFFEGRQVRKPQRELLDVYGLLISRLQGRASGSGIIWLGKECRATRVRLNPDPRKSERLLEGLRQMQSAETTPRLILNDHCAVCEFRQRCHQQAVQEDNISLLRGMKEKEVKDYARKGILTLTQLAHMFRPRRMGKRVGQRKNRRYHALQAMAIRDKQIYVFGTPELPDRPVKIYLDIEGLPDEGFVYLIGMIVAQGGKETQFSFWADNKDKELEIFEQFLVEVSHYDDFQVFCYGSYERAFLRRMRKATERTASVDRVLAALVNVLSLVYAHLYFPCYSNGLKDVAAYLECCWTEPEASGAQSIVWRTRWDATHAGEWKTILATYNMQDCAALKKVTEVVYNTCLRTDVVAQPALGKVAIPPVARVGDIDKVNETHHWGRTQFTNPDFTFVNKFSYFDYQRERVYARTSRKIKKKNPRKHRNRKLPVSQYLEMTSECCPQCGCPEIIQIPSDNRTRKLYTKRAFDLLFSPGKIRRRVIECHGSFYSCSRCSHRFLPPAYERLDKHWHGLKSWAMYNHVQHGFSLKALQTILNESFGLHVHSGEIHMFKALMAHHYRPTYEGVLRKIMTGAVLHADETEVILKSGKGYVWVFAGIEDVVFMYRPTREGDFLRSLLKDFHGVLVTDFYAAYDAIDCPQQKCLIHLIRDMNQDLLANPYDEELKLLTGPFGVLLRDAVTTIDQHGLKHRFLKKHEKAAGKFFEYVASQSFGSETAEALRMRLLKYRDKLFTFIGHDGVSWNNNLAEYAIKRFACYRKGTVGSLQETGIADYLTLLSIAHTCRIRGISFLQFLLSQHLTLDTYSSRSGRSRRRQEVESYPTEFMPTRLAGLEKLRERGKPGNEEP